ncbi:formin-J-like isoform X2 [Anneissia japonica]|uniref:formin-J-like isoform X2 n=1 Tax=Anneissia japonica TaxID=1529436 RepID=UPI0014256A24|nr:formin-J-like isoform X2 [Anneissia japonica]
MSTKLRLSSDEQFWVMCQVKHGLRTVDEALDFLRKEHSRDGCEVTEVEIDYDTSYPTCEVPQFTEEIVLERVKSRTRNFFRHFSRQWTVRHSNAFNEQPVSPKARTRPQSLFFVQSPKIEEEWEKGDELLDLLITEGKLTNDDKRDLQLKFSDNYKTGDAQRMILGNLVKSGRITIDDAMHYSRILGIIATAEKEAHDIAEANSAFATKKVYNFGIYKYYRHRPCQRRILQIDFQACFICNIQKGNLNRKFNFSEVLDYESEEGLRFFINFTDHHEYEMEADSPEDKEKICRLLQMIVEQNRSHEKGRALTIHDRATTLPRVQAVLKEGLLEKKNHNLYTTWTKRWVRIRQGELSYYKPDEDKHTALNILQLAHDITSVKKAGDSAVSIATRKKMYLFRIPSNSQLSAKEIIKARDEWIRALKYACGDRWMDSEPFNDAYNRAVNAARDQVHGVKNQDHIRSTVKDFQKELETLNAVLSIMNVKGDAKVAMDKLQNMAISIETMMKAKENNETSNVITTQRDNTEKTEEEIYDTNSVTESSYTTVDVDFRQNQVNNASQSIGREKFPTSAAAMVQFENNDADDNRASMKSAPEAERGLSEMAGPSTSGFSEKLYDHGGSIRNSIMSSEPEYADDVYLQARNDDSATESARPSTPSSPIEPDSERSNTHSVPPPPPLPPPDLLGAVPPPPPPPPPAVAYALEHKFTVKSNVKMRPFHWNKTPVPMVCTSVWKDTRDVTCKLDLVKLEAIFGSQDGKVQTVVQNTVKKKIKTLLDPKLAQNLGIFLSGFKIDLNDLKNRLVILYECDGGLSPEHISALRRFQPTTEDKEMYKSYDGNPTELEATDRFMILMCGIPNLRIRLDLLSTVNEFPVQYEDLAPTIGNVIEACKELYSNQRFIAVLEYILATGNFVNSTTGKGQALGFRLSALTKLTDCRSKDKNYTLLKFIVEQMYQQEPDLLNIMDDLLPITKVPDASIKALQAEAEIMKKDLCKIRKNASILLNHEEASEEDANFCAQINSFVEHYDAKMATLSSKSEEMGTAYTLVLTRFGESLNTDSEELFSGVNAFIKDFQKEVDLLVAADAAALHSATKFQLSQSMKTDTFSESEECSTLERSSSVSSMESQTIFRSPSGTPTHVQELRKAFGEKARKEAGMSTFEKELRRVNKKEKPKTKKESSSKNGAKKSNKKPTKEGYMEKLSSGRNQTWNKRYFELAQTGHLHYSKKKNDRSVESIYLRDCPCTVEGEDERIIVLETEERVYKFRAPSKTESVNWMTGILAYTGRK